MGTQSFENVDDMFEKMEEINQGRMVEFEKVKHTLRLNKPIEKLGFICVSFRNGTLLLKPFVEKMLAWPTGEIRGYVNQYGLLCLNLPVSEDECDEDGEESIPEGEDIFKILSETNQPYEDLESSNIECYIFPYPYFINDARGFGIIDPAIDPRQITPEVAKRNHLHQVQNFKELADLWNEINTIEEE